MPYMPYFGILNLEDAGFIKTYSSYSGTISSIANTYDGSTATYGTQTSQSASIVFTYTGTCPTTLYAYITTCSSLWDIYAESDFGDSSTFGNYTGTVFNLQWHSSTNGTSWTYEGGLSNQSPGTKALNFSGALSPYIRITIWFSYIFDEPGWLELGGAFLSGTMRVNEVLYE